MSERQNASVGIDKEPVPSDISEQPEAAQSQTSSDNVEVESEDQSVANIERIYR
jgi:hypothetical protein